MVSLLCNSKAIPWTDRSGSEIYNPYLAARREWDERYGDQITRARNWRTMAFLSGADRFACHRRIDLAIEQVPCGSLRGGH